MRLKFSAVAAVVVFSGPLSAQGEMSVDEAHRMVNRLIVGPTGVPLFTSGRWLEGAVVQVSSPRAAGRCVTIYSETQPYDSRIAVKDRGKFSTDNEIRWKEASDLRVVGNRFYWKQIRKATGRPFDYFFVLPSSRAARELEAAGTVLAAACNSTESSAQPIEEKVHDPARNSASLAIDRRDGSRYGWAIDYKNWSQSDARALAECQRTGARCQVVLRFTGGCGAYAADQANGSTVYGWGTARNRQDAEARAWDEARRRGATSLVTRVWGCNSSNTAGSAARTSAGEGSLVTSPPALPGKGKLSEDVIRRNEAAAAAHQSMVDAHQRKLEENAAKLQRAVAERKAKDEAYQRELARAQAAQREFERQQQAYREEYKRITGHYPDE